MSVTNVARDERTARSWRRSRLLLAFLCVAGLLWGGWAWWMNSRYQSAMDEIRSEIGAGRYALACRELDNLLTWKSDPKGELVYVLGSCELARGRERAAGEAWARVVPGSAFSARAIEGRMQILLESGQLAAAEQLVNAAALDPRNDRTALLVLLVPMLSESGRIDEAERLIEQRWEYLNAAGKGALEAAIKLVQQHIELTLKPTRVETDPLLARYRELHDRQQPFRDAVEAARLAEQLGRRFEARAFLTIAIEEEPTREDLQHNLERLSATPATVVRTP